ncbi:MAG: hypothetical protein ACLKAK_07360 [Alkaliphilus sp.]
MSNKFCINKSGEQMSVREIPSGNQIGTIFNREAFGLDLNSSHGSATCIIFRNSSGQVKPGYILDPEPSNFYTPCSNHSHGAVTINGVQYITFKFRRKETVYRADRTTWGSVAANQRIACKDALSGDTNAHWKAINYVESTNGSWVKVDGAGFDYGFVNTGLEDGSMPNTISMYGTW